MKEFEGVERDGRDESVHATIFGNWSKEEEAERKKERSGKKMDGGDGIWYDVGG